MSPLSFQSVCVRSETFAGYQVAHKGRRRSLPEHNPSSCRPVLGWRPNRTHRAGIILQMYCSVFPECQRIPRLRFARGLRAGRLLHRPVSPMTAFELASSRMYHRLRAGRLLRKPLWSTFLFGLAIVHRCARCSVRTALWLAVLAVSQLSCAIAVA